MNCWNAKVLLEKDHANQQPSRPNGDNVGRKVHRLGVEEPTNKTPLASRILRRKDEDIVEAIGKPVEQPAKRSIPMLSPLLVSSQALSITSGFMADTVALATLLHSSEDLGVFRRIGVAVRAMGLGLLPHTVFTVIASLGVFKVRDSFKMAWSHASAITAEVIGFVSIGKRAIGPLINPVVGGLVGSRAIGTTTDAKSAVATGIKRSCPYPTRPKFGPSRRDGAILVDLAPKAVFNWHSFSERCASWHSEHIIPGCRNNINSQLASFA